MSTLGVLLVVVGAALIVAEAHVPAHGALGTGGAAALTTGVVLALSGVGAPGAAVVAAGIAVALAGVGRFVHNGRTEALWAGIAPRDALAALHRKVDRALVSVGLAPDRRAYLPHVTLARLSRGMGAEPAITRWLADHAALASPPFVLSHVALYESHLGRDAARYEAVARWPLG